MVFTRLSIQEKEAFFGLLDEYFQSRPEIFKQHGDGQGASGLAGTGISTTAAASAVQRALGAAHGTTGPSASAGAGRSNNMAGIDVTHALPAMGRVAAASLAFSGSGASSGAPSPPSLGPSPPPPPGVPAFPRRGGAAAHALASVEHAAGTLPGSEVDKLVTRKTGMLSSFGNKTPATATGGATVPPAFVAPKNTFGPPPVRRVTSETPASATSAGSGGGGAQRHAAPAEPEPEPEAAAGEWAEVLYDYSSEDPGDLTIEAGTRVLVIARSSDDWWSGQSEGQGREGLFPASYVKLL